MAADLRECGHAPYCTKGIYGDAPDHPHPVLVGAYADLERLDVPMEQAASLIQTTLMLAASVDTTSSARDLPGLSRELRYCFEELAKAAPAKAEEADGLDELNARRAARSATA